MAFFFSIPASGARSKRVELRGILRMYDIDTRRMNDRKNVRGRLEINLIGRAGFPRGFSREEHI